jgi:hypothetical protein
MPTPTDIQRFCSFHQVWHLEFVVGDSGVIANADPPRLRIMVVVR